MKNFNGKAIYNPSGKAGEYAEWACNFYAGCSNGCEYCYLTKGRSAKTYEHRYPKLKKCFRSEDHALEVFKKELFGNVEQLRQHGLFFSFTTDPMLPETSDLTIRAVWLCVQLHVPVKILTKRTDEIAGLLPGCKNDRHSLYQRYVAIGFTLTGHDGFEPNASTNAERIEAMRILHDAGFKTFASIEPIIDVDDSLRMISKTARSGICDLYKIGLESGKKYDKQQILNFISTTIKEVEYFGNKAKIYFKDSLLKQAGIDRTNLPENCVGRDYNIFT